ncbi:MAG: hypothetical protein DHS20C21_06890 [Gemmatimonadota bacterium]|nr:MAG: hypothetical protein DHS20C21_06890 [Gemmatimonadota bacterium]
MIQVRRLSLLTTLLAAVAPAPSSADAGVAQGGPAARTAVLLFSNFSGTSRAPATVMPLVYRELEARGVPHLSHITLRPILRQHRIRTVRGITGPEANLLREGSQVELLLLGSCDVFLDAENPEVAISARLVDTETMRVVSAQSVAATGEDDAGLFSVGRITSLDELAGRVVARLVDDLELSFQRPQRDPSEAPLPTVAIVPLDNTSKARGAGEVVSSQLLSELLTRGFEVIEPGRVNDLFLRNGRVLRGGVDREMLARMSEAFGMDFVVTGEVETFRVGRGELETAAPSFAFGARLIAADGTLRMSHDEARDGRDSEHLFGLGRRRSLGELSRDSLKRLVRRIVEETEESVAIARRTHGSP